MLKSLCLSLVVVLSSVVTVHAGDSILDKGNASVSEQLKQLLKEEEAALTAYAADKADYDAKNAPFKQHEAAATYAKIVRENLQKDLEALDLSSVDNQLQSADAALKTARDELDAAKAAYVGTDPFLDPTVREKQAAYDVASIARQKAFDEAQAAETKAAEVSLRRKAQYILKLESPRKPTLVEVLKQELRNAQSAEAKAYADMAEPKRLADEAKAKADASKAILDAIQEKIREATNTGNGNGLRTEVEKLRQTADVRIGEVACEVKALRATTAEHFTALTSEVGGVKTEIGALCVEVANLNTTVDTRLAALTTKITKIESAPRWELRRNRRGCNEWVWVTN